ncbi:unnamed protein product [Protopolystoma xenopodis]|uniref:Uncharacterized protein n=1 Tax=Protopolystoma xenopodis TaxID=117903 RepID=A0A3S5AD72_9PLAT|nr:unnamed protein product [Protopolystoma xenopodis]
MLNLCSAFVRRVAGIVLSSCFGERSDDVRPMTDESSARIHRGRRAVRRGLICINLQSHFFGEASSRIPSTRPFRRRESFSVTVAAPATRSGHLEPTTPGSSRHEKTLENSSI